MAEWTKEDCINVIDLNRSKPQCLQQVTKEALTAIGRFGTR
jgi:hypothetical protein